jgi:Dynein light chain type 1
MSSERKAVIKSADMSEDMQQDAVDCASQALEKYNIEKVRTANNVSFDQSPRLP